MVSRKVLNNNIINVEASVDGWLINNESNK